MPDLKEVEKMARTVVSPLKTIAHTSRKYERPWPDRESSREPIAEAKHQNDFKKLQEIAAGTATTLEKSGATIIADHKTIQRNMVDMKKYFDDYYRIFQAQGTTNKVSSLLMEVNAAVRYWKDLDELLAK